MPGSETIVISELVDEKAGAGGVECGRMTMVSDAGQWINISVVCGSDRPEPRKLRTPRIPIRVSECLAR